MAVEYPWYAVAEGEDLQQGDFIDYCEVLVPGYTLNDATEENTSANKSVYRPVATTDIYDLVIVSQSCDLGNGKIDYVLMCPRWSYKEYAAVNSDFKKLDKLEQIRQGRSHRYCMLNQCDLAEQPCEIQIVDLGTVFSIPYDVMKQMAKLNGKRLRLLSPYKEKLAQAFAYYYMRVALPVDIPRFERVKDVPLPGTKSGH